MTYVSVDVDVDLGDILDALSKEEVKSLVRELIQDGYGPEPSDLLVHGEIKITDQLTDPVILLETIVWLRKNGYTVEPKEELYSTPERQKEEV